MNEFLNTIQDRWAFGLALVIGFPLIMIALNELGFAVARAGHPAARSIRFFRTWVVPSFALAVFLRWVVLLPNTSLGMHCDRQIRTLLI